MIQIFSAAHCGASKGQLETLRILSKHHALLWLKNIRGDLPLHEAVQSGRKDLVRWLLTKKPHYVDSSNNDGRTALHIAALNNNVEMSKVKGFTNFRQTDLIIVLLFADFN